MASTRRLIPLLALTLSAASSAFAEGLEVKSPDGRFVVSFSVRDVGAARACPVYRVTWQGKTLVAESRLGLDLEGAPLRENLGLVGSTAVEGDSVWKPVCGERAEIRDHYRELAVELREIQPQNRRLVVTFRAFNEGVAISYTLPKQPGLEKARIAAEHTEFRFESDFPAWATYQAQGLYERVPLSKVKTGCERPLVIPPCSRARARASCGRRPQRRWSR